MPARKSLEREAPRGRADLFNVRPVDTPTAALVKPATMRNARRAGGSPFDRAIPQTIGIGINKVPNA